MVNENKKPCPVCKSRDKLIAKDSKIPNDPGHRELRIKCQNRTCVSGPDKAKAIGPAVKYRVPHMAAAGPDAIALWNDYCDSFPSDDDTGVDVPSAGDLDGLDD